MSGATRVLAIAVNYNTDREALAWLAALGRVTAGLPAGQVTPMIVDNTPRAGSEDFFRALRAVHPRVIAVKAPSNLGYFGGAEHGWETWRSATNTQPDWVMVSNVDVDFVDAAFFPTLLGAAYPAGTGVVGPAIFSVARKGDWNPKISERPSARTMRRYVWLYRSHWVFNLYEQAARVKYALASLRKKAAVASIGQCSRPMLTYAVHGACMLFRRDYFERGGDLRYPSFLFGEEIFVAETARKLGLSTWHDPRLKLLSRDHASTGRFRTKTMTKYMQDSAVVLVERFFN